MMAFTSASSMRELIASMTSGSAATKPATGTPSSIARWTASVR